MTRWGSAASAALADRRPVDLRLVAMALACWLASFAAMQTRTPVALAGALAAAIGAAVLWRWTGRAALAGVGVAVLLGMAGGGVATAARLAGRDAPAVVQPARAHASVTAELTIRRDPRRIGGDPARPPGWLAPAWLHRLAPEHGAEGTRMRVRILVLSSDPGWQSILPGQRVRASGRLQPPRGGDLTAAVLSASGPPEPLGEPPWLLRAAGSLRAGLRAASAPLPAEPGGLLPGLAVGDVSNLDAGLADDFFATGMTHLVAVSGTHLVIVTGFVFLLARAARAPPWLTATVSGLTIAGYVILCQASPSVVRAGVMAVIALVALAAGRLRSALPALGATVTILVVVDPQLAADPAFTMSVLATAGLVLLAPRWRDALRRRGVPAGLAEALVIPAAAQVSVAPVIAGLSGTVSLVAVVANLVATPVMAPATLLGVLAAAVSPASSAAAELLAWLASWPAWWLVLVSRYGARAPAAVVPWPAGVAGAALLAALTVALLLLFRHRRARMLVVAVTAAVVVGALPVKTLAGGWPPPGAVLVTCAIGQGDLVVVPVATGEAIVVDAGPEPAAADRCLRDLRIRSIPLLVISHYHADHVAGIDGVLRGRDVAAVLTTGLPEPAFGHDLVATAVAGVPVVVARAGARYRVGDVSLTVLGPPFPLVGTRSDPNNNSVVILAQVRGVRVLLTGDAEVELQEALLDTVGAGALRAEILKVPHHGSPYQSPELLAAVAPAVAMVPVGADNPHGHPSPAVLAGLERDGARVLRTDLDGDVAAVQPRPGELAVVTHDPRSPRRSAIALTGRLAAVGAGQERHPGAGRNVATAVACDDCGRDPHRPCGARARGGGAARRPCGGRRGRGRPGCGPGDRGTGPRGERALRGRAGRAAQPVAVRRCPRGRGPPRSGCP